MDSWNRVGVLADLAGSAGGGAGEADLRDVAERHVDGVVAGVFAVEDVKDYKGGVVDAGRGGRARELRCSASGEGEQHRCSESRHLDRLLACLRGGDEPKLV